MRWMWCAVVVACAGGDDPEPSTQSSATDTGRAEGVRVREVANEPHLVTVERAPAVSGPVAIACDAGASEGLLWEFASGDGPLTLVGLLDDTAYDCTLLDVDTDVRTPFTVRSAGGDAPTTSVQTHATLTPSSTPFTLLNTNEQCGSSSSARRPWLRIYDLDGQARWGHRLPADVNLSTEARYHGDGLVVWGGGYATDYALQWLMLDHTVVDTRGHSVAPDATMFHHDGKLLDDGTELMLAEVPNTNGITTWLGWRVVGQGGSWTGSVDSQQLFDEGLLRPGAPDDDVYHANWTDLVDGVLYVSQCFTDDLMAIDPATGEVEWRLGREGPGLQLLDHDGTPLPDSELPICPHGLEVVGDRVLFYDNGRYGQRNHSRALELQIDAVNGTATRTWMWEENDWFENAMGDIDDLGEGRVLIHQAHVECWGLFTDRTNLVELDISTQEVSWRMTFDDPEVSSYRAERIDACDAIPHVRFCPGVEARRSDLGL